MVLHISINFMSTAESGAPMAGPISLMGLLVMTVGAGSAFL